MDKAYLLKLAKSFLFWLHGLGAVFVSAAANSLVVTQVDPVAFNFGAQWKKTAMVAVVSGIVGAALYLAKSPLPSLPTDTPTTEEKQS